MLWSIQCPWQGLLVPSSTPQSRTQSALLQTQTGRLTCPVSTWVSLEEVDLLAMMSMQPSPKWPSGEIPEGCLEEAHKCGTTVMLWNLPIKVFHSCESAPADDRVAQQRCSHTHKHTHTQSWSWWCSSESAFQLHTYVCSMYVHTYIDKQTFEPVDPGL